MRYLFPVLLVFLLFGWHHGPIQAQQPVAPGQEVEVLPPQGALQPAPQLMPQGYYPPVFPAIPPRLPRVDSREVWQYMGVTETGRYRPRVILAPQGSYYYYNRAPYPWISNRSTAFMPYALD